MAPPLDNLYHRILRPLMFRLDPERAHRWTLAMMAGRFAILRKPAPDPPALATAPWGHPVFQSDRARRGDGQGYSRGAGWQAAGFRLRRTRHRDAAGRSPAIRARACGVCPSIAHWSIGWVFRALGWKRRRASLDRSAPCRLDNSPRTEPRAQQGHAAGARGGGLCGAGRASGRVGRLYRDQRELAEYAGAARLAVGGAPCAPDAPRF